MRGQQKFIRVFVAFGLCLAIVGFVPRLDTSVAASRTKMNYLTAAEFDSEPGLEQLHNPLRASAKNVPFASAMSAPNGTRSSSGCPIQGAVEVGRADCDTALYEDNPSITPDCKTPLILIHGIHGNQWPAKGPNAKKDDPRIPYTGYFQTLISKLHTKFPDIDSKFKIYRFHYRSDIHPVREIARSLRNRLDELIRADKINFDKKFVVVAHSMGGLVARSYLNEFNHDAGEYTGRKGGERVIKLITLGTPHHGTPVANGDARTPLLSPIWRRALAKLDDIKWKGDGCPDCARDPRHPNRGDLRFDNFDSSWNTRFNYVLDLPTEENKFLQEIPHTYDHLIYPYWGTIDEGLMVKTLGPLGLIDLVIFLKVQADAGYENQALESLGVILHRSIAGDFDAKPTSLSNDGMVPDKSARFDRFSDPGKLVHCFKTNHQDLQWGTPRKCERGGVTKSLIDFLVDDLSTVQAPGCPKVLVSTSLQLSPAPEGYRTGQPITSTFSVRNAGTAKIELRNLLTSGRLAGTCPNGVCPDFTSRTNLTLMPGQSYSYSGSFTPTRTGNYTFSVAYEGADGNWVIPVKPENNNKNQVNINVINIQPNVVVSRSLTLTPGTGPLPLGQAVNGTFSITNRGAAALTMRQVLIAGRLADTCPNNVCPDFSPINPNITLNPGQTYNYSGRINLTQAGTYTFSVAYQTMDGKWELPVKSENGTINKLSIIVQGPLPTLTRRSPDSLLANSTLQSVDLYGTRLRTIVYCSLKFPSGQSIFLYMPLSQVFAVSDTQIRIKTKFLSPGTYYVTAWTLDGKSNEFPIVVR